MIYCSWIGVADIKNLPLEAGSTITALNNLPDLSNVFLIWNEDTDEIVNAKSVESYSKTIESLFPWISVTTEHQPLSDPTVHQDVFDIQKDLLQRLLDDFDEDIVVNITPGTPSMHSAWLIASGIDMSRIATIQTSPEGKVRQESKFFPLIESVLPYVSLGIQTAYTSDIQQPSSLAFSDDSAVVRLENQLRKIAPHNEINVLLLGEPGSGKERFAEYLAQYSNSSGLLAVNCAAISGDLFESQMFGYKKGAFTGAVTDSPGFFQTASEQNKILFLDELGDLSLAGQAKLLRAIEYNEIQEVGNPTPKKLEREVRIVAATNKNLAVEIEKGNFRADLFYRLDNFKFQIPALRERQSELVTIFNFFLKEKCRKNNKKLSLDSSACSFIKNYDWPGNFREIQSLITRLVVFTDSGTQITEELLVESLESELAPLSHADLTKMNLDPDELSDRVLAEFFKPHLQRNKYNVKQTCEDLGWERQVGHKLLQRCKDIIKTSK